MPIDPDNLKLTDFMDLATLQEIQDRGITVVHGGTCPLLVVYHRSNVYALDNRCPHLGFPLHRGSVEDGILICHWHHARFDLASGGTFDLWADDVPTCPVEIRAGGEIWVKPVFGYRDSVGHWRERLEDGLGHNLGLVIAKAVHGQLAAGSTSSDVVRQAALFGANTGGLSQLFTSVFLPFYLLFLVYFLLAFFLYATLFAGLGAMVKGQDEVTSATQVPLMLIIIGWIAVIFGFSSPNATWMKALSYLPFWTPMVMLVRLALGTVAWWEVVATTALMLVAILACTWFAARLYRYGVLMYGQRPGLGRLLKLVRMN